MADLAASGQRDAPIRDLVKRGGYAFPAAYNATLDRRRWLCRPSAAHRTHHLHLILDRDTYTAAKSGFVKRHSV